MEDKRSPPPGLGPLPLVRNPRDILRLALEVAARCGDPNPEMIEHMMGTREAVTTTTASLVFGDEPVSSHRHARPIPQPVGRGPRSRHPPKPWRSSCPIRFRSSSWRSRAVA